MPEKYVVHEVEWNNEQVSNFWNQIYNRGTTGFADCSAGTILNIIKKKISLKGRILDYGAGNGNFTKVLCEKLLKSSISCCEYSECAVNKLTNSLGNYKNFEGAFLIDNIQQKEFDAVFVLEVIEHLSEEQLNTFFIRINSLLRKGGRLIITVPNNENIDSKKVLCPECGAIFHPIQHLKSYNAELLIKTCRRNGFEKYLIKQSYLNTKVTMKNWLKKIFFFIAKNESPNLIGIFTKK